MSLQDYSNGNIFDLLAELNPTRPDLCAEIDPYIAAKLHDVESLAEVFYYLCYGDMYQVLPETKKKINTILNSYLEKFDNIDWWRFEAYRDWFDDTMKANLTKRWLEDGNAKTIWMADYVPRDSKLAVQALTRLTDIYKSRRTKRNILTIESLFRQLSDEHLEKACEVVSKSTPAIAVCLLSREDIDEKYTLKGLKALSKLSRQRSVSVKIDFDMLKHLGPKARLDAMKQLLGMIDKYAGNEDRLPFTNIPNREEVETFLFPCSLKYNEQVVELIEKFDQLTASH